MKRNGKNASKIAFLNDAYVFPHSSQFFLDLFVIVIVLVVVVLVIVIILIVVIFVFLKLNVAVLFGIRKDIVVLRVGKIGVAEPLVHGLLARLPVPARGKKKKKNEYQIKDMYIPNQRYV